LSRLTSSYHWFLFLLCLLFSTSLRASDAVPTILVVQSYHAQNSWDQSYIDGLQQTLGSSYQLEYFRMDTKRLPTSVHTARAEAAWQHYLQLQPVLVILGDDNALRLLGPRLAEASTPVVYLGINNNPRSYGVVSSGNITGVLERPLLKRSVLLLNQIIDVKRVLILFDSGTTAHAVKSESFYNKDSVTIRNVDADIALVSSFAEWQQQVLTAKRRGYDALVVGLYHTLVDAQGEHVDAQKVVNWTSQHSLIPPFGFWDFSVGKDKTIGGYVLHGKEQGIAAGQLALKILAGAHAGRILPQTAPEGRFLFSRTQLQKWQIIDRLGGQFDVEYLE